MHTVWPYLSGIGCSVCFGLATIFEQVAAKRQANIESLNPSQLFNLARQLPYTLGIILDLVGWVLFIVASRTLPLYLVMSFVAASLVVTAITARLYLSIKIRRSEAVAISSIMLGIILLGTSAESSTNQAINYYFKFLVEIFPIPIAILGWSILKTPKSSYSVVGISVLSGLAFGGTGLVAKVINFNGLNLHSLFQPLILSLLAYGALGLLLLASALQRGVVNKVNSIMFATELVIPSFLGIIFLGDRASHGLWPVMVAGFAFVSAGIIIISLPSKIKA